jgi:hypothetical protein
MAAADLVRHVDFGPGPRIHHEMRARSSFQASATIIEFEGVIRGEAARIESGQVHRTK